MKSSEITFMQASKQSRASRVGMTLVEVMVATILSVLLLMALTGVLKAMHENRKALAKEFPSEKWKSQFVDQLTWDILNSRQIHVNSVRVRLIGYASRDIETGIPTQRPTEIVYSVDVVENRSWLVRQENHLDEMTTASVSRELVAEGIRELKLYRVDSGGSDHDMSAGANIQKAAYSIPANIRFMLYGSSSTPLATGSIQRLN